ncbi:MAG: 4Fe-4S dicluster domain-containing protein [Chloroflexi bacterium]|nr:4Fe-4S dicluster domain-containing protein [Chloroflexota bacterium]
MTRNLYVIDLGRCTGCRACAIACRDRAHGGDGLAWLRVETTEAGQYPHVRITHRVVHCFHCSQAPCIAACPTEALVREARGLVQVIGERCVRCGACVEACPFGAITLGDQGPATKCDGCADELAQGREPTCVRACPMRALHYVEEQVWALPPRRVVDEAFDGHAAGPAVRYLKRPEE